MQRGGNWIGPGIPGNGCSKELEGMMEETVERLDLVSQGKGLGWVSNTAEAQIHWDGEWEMESHGDNQFHQVSNPNISGQIFAEGRSKPSDEPYQSKPSSLEKEPLVLFHLEIRRERKPLSQKDTKLSSYIHWPSPRPPNPTSPMHLPLCCQSLPKSFKTWLPSGLRV